jgi:hypothetical protein
MLSYGEDTEKERQERTIFENLDKKSGKYPGNDKPRVNAHLQFMQAFPCLRGIETLSGADLDPMGMLVDIAKMKDVAKVKRKLHFL